MTLFFRRPAAPEGDEAPLLRRATDVPWVVFVRQLWVVIAIGVTLIIAIMIATYRTKPYEARILDLEQTGTELRARVLVLEEIAKR